MMRETLADGGIVPRMIVNPEHVVPRAAEPSQPCSGRDIGRAVRGGRVASLQTAGSPAVQIPQIGRTKAGFGRNVDGAASSHVPDAQGRVRRSDIASEFIEEAGVAHHEIGAAIAIQVARSVLPSVSRR